VEDLEPHVVYDLWSAGRRAKGLANPLMVAVGRSLWLNSLVALVAVVSSCGSARDDAVGATKVISVPGVSLPTNLPERQKEALADGAVTLAEYSQAFELFADCSQSAGAALGNVRTSPLSGLISYGVPAGNMLGVPGQADPSPVGQCYEELFSFIELVFQVTDPAVLQQGIDEQNQQFAIEGVPCLVKNGVEPPTSIDTSTQEGLDWMTEFAELAQAGRC